MKKLRCCCMLLCLGLYAQAQPPLTWQCEASRIDSFTCELVFSAEIQPGWRLYAHTQPGLREGTMVLNLSRSNYSRLIGKPIECGVFSTYEVAGNGFFYGYDGSVSVRQRVKITGDSAQIISGEFQYLLGNDQYCMPLTYNFNAPILFSHVQYSRARNEPPPGTFLTKRKKQKA